MFKNPFSFSGRIGRTEYVLSMILTSIPAWIFIDMLEEREAVWVLFPVALLLWFKLSQGAKRCHDMGCSGWHQLIPLFEFLMLISGGEETANEYDQNPKGIATPKKGGKKGSYKRKLAG